MLRLINPLLTILFLIFSTPLLNAQNTSCNCRTDLDFLNKRIKKLPAYSINKENYKKRFIQVEKEIENIGSDYNCFVQLNRLLLSINDNHSRVYGINSGMNKEVLKDSVKFEKFKQSEVFNFYPRPNINLDSLKTTLNKQPFNAIEGIYTRPSYMTVGVYKQLNDTVYTVIILESNNKLWEVGEVLYTLIPFGNKYLLAIGGSLGTKSPTTHTERIENGIFLTFRFQKDPSKPNFSVSKYPNSTYFREEISPEITYLKIGSFDSWYPTLSDAEKFYKTLEGTLIKKNLIIDLRDNGGGGDRNSDILFNILKNYLNNNNEISVLINNRTGSNAEQFAFKMKRFDNCKTYGNRTNGTATFEIKKGFHPLPCGKFRAVLASKKHSDYLVLESVGLKPDVKFKQDTDWLIQLENIIQANK